MFFLHTVLNFYLNAKELFRAWILNYSKIFQTCFPCCKDNFPRRNNSFAFQYWYLHFGWIESVWYWILSRSTPYVLHDMEEFPGSCHPLIFASSDDSLMPTYVKLCEYSPLIVLTGFPVNIWYIRMTKSSTQPGFAWIVPSISSLGISIPWFSGLSMK